MTTVLPLETATADEWLSTIPAYQRDSFEQLMGGGMSEEETIAFWLSRNGPDQTVGFGAGSNAGNYLSSVKTEFRKLMCGDEAYEPTRKEATKVWEGGRLSVVSVIASAIAIHVGIAVAVLVPVIALLLSAVGKVGLEAWCKMPPPEEPTMVA